MYVNVPGFAVSFPKVKVRELRLTALKLFIEKMPSAAISLAPKEIWGVVPKVLLNARLLKVDTALPPRVCIAVDPLKLTDPSLCVKVLLFVKSPAKLNILEVAVKVPAFILSDFKVIT